jgi:hypothetical protein
MSHKRCAECGLYNCSHIANGDAGSFYGKTKREVPSPGWDKFCEAEAKIKNSPPITAARTRYRSVMPYPGGMNTALKQLVEIAKDYGWNIDVASAINADGNKGYIITVLEPKK